VLRQAAREQCFFYLYDTFPAMANLEPYDIQQHRDLFANLAKRCKFFVVAPGKMNLPNETFGQIELGYRYFEGAAAGAVMIGQAPNTDAFRTSFGWVDSVIPVRSDGSDLRTVLASLTSEPGRMAAISHRNAAEALTRHDWLHRWKEILRIAGLSPGEGLLGRERRLSDLAITALEMA
jgi:hypothetical protein